MRHRCFFRSTTFTLAIHVELKARSPTIGATSSYLHILRAHKRRHECATRVFPLSIVSLPFAIATMKATGARMATHTDCSCAQAYARARARRLPSPHKRRRPSNDTIVLQLSRAKLSQACGGQLTRTNGDGRLFCSSRSLASTLDLRPCRLFRSSWSSLGPIRS